jgi:nitrogen regulatory protein P-II 2
VKLIIAIIRTERLDAVQQALQSVLDEGDNYRLTAQTVDGHGRQQGEVEVFRGRTVRVRMVQKTQITLGVNDAYVEKAVAAIVKAARTGEKGDVGDGKIFVMPLEDCVRIRTGERGGGAI